MLNIQACIMDRKDRDQMIYSFVYSWFGLLVCGTGSHIIQTDLLTTSHIVKVTLNV